MKYRRSIKMAYTKERHTSLTFKIDETIKDDVTFQEHVQTIMQGFENLGFRGHVVI
jgi:hypothetical protein